MAPSVRAFDGQVVIEIDPAAEQRLDVAAVRRLIALELSDVDVPGELGSKGGQAKSLFFRVLGAASGELRIELWEHGTFHGARIIAGAAANRQLGARRVALGAAELARRLRERRRAESRRTERALRRERLLLAEAQTRTLDGPQALRTSFVGGRVSSGDFLLFGPNLALQLHVTKKLRLDLGASAFGGFGPAELLFEWNELSFGVMRRFSLARTIDLDVGAQAGAAVVRFDRAREVDNAPNTASWTARSTALLRLEPRLTRYLRLSIGAEAGALLREMAVLPRAGSVQELGGLWLSADLGLVVTPL